MDCSALIGPRQSTILSDIVVTFVVVTLFVWNRIPVVLASGSIRRHLGSPSTPRPQFPNFLAPSQIGFSLHLECYPFDIRNELLPVEILTFSGDHIQVKLNGAANVSIRIPEPSNSKSLGLANVIEEAVDPTHPGFNFF